jgi:uncharacterized protein (TIGR02147 family)
MKSIYSYGHYRPYLKDWFQARKQEPSGFSYGKFSALAGLGSPNYMKLVIEGKRNLTTANIHQVAAAMALGFDETQFFEALVLLDQSKLDKEKAYYRQRLASLRKAKPKAGVALKGTDLLAQWYFPAVVVCLDGSLAGSNHAEIVAKTGLKKEQIDTVVAILRREGVLREENGKLKVEYAHFVAHDKKLLSQANKNFQREQLRISLATLEKSYEKGPKFFSHTFTVAKGNFPAYVEKVAGFLEELAAQSNDEAPEEVLQLNLQFFRLLDRA